MTTTMDDQMLTREQTRALHRLASKLEREAQTCRLGDLTDRAQKLEAEAQQVRQKIETATDARQERDLEDLRTKNRMQERHERQEREREEQGARQAAAEEWMRSHQWHKEPIETVGALRAASEAGIAAGDLLAVCKRVRRLRDGADCLTVFDHLRRDYRPLHEG